MPLRAERGEPYTLWPGSDAARVKGCICPVLDNGHGNIGLARDRGGWVIFSDCPLHGIGGTAPAEIPQQNRPQVLLPVDRGDDE